MPIIPGFGLIKPNRQVILNPNYPKPVFCTLCPLVPFDLLGRPVRQSPAASGNLPLPIVTQWGAGINSNSMSSYSFNSPSGEFAGNITMLLVWSPLQNTGGFQGVIEKRDSGNGAEFGVNFQYGSSYQWFCLSTNHILNCGAANLPAVNSLASTVFIRDNSAGMRVFQNGALIGSDALTSAPPSFQGIISFGYYDGVANGGGSPGENTNIGFLLCAMWKSALSDGRAIQLSLRPFDLLMPAESWSYKAPAAAASTIVFRKTLSQIGGRVGTRQPIGWGM